MKKMKTAAILAAVLLFLSGCGEGGAPADPYLYLDVQGMTKFNTLTGTMTSLCMDPLCGHTSEEGCVFGGIRQMFAVEDGKMYYSVYVREDRNDGNYTGTAYRVYDLKTGSARELYREVELRYGNISEANSVVGDWQYICRSGDLDAYYRVNFKTGEMEDLSDLSEVIMPIYEDEQYLYAPIADSVHTSRTGVFRVSHDFTGKEILFDAGEFIGNIDFTAMDAGYIYYTTYKEDSYDLHRYTVKTNAAETVLTDLLSVVICGDGIIYTEKAEDPVFLYFDAWRNRDMYDNVRGRIYRCDLDGSDRELIFDNDSYLVRAMDMRLKDDLLIFDFGEIVEMEYTNGEMMPRLDSAAGGKIVLDLKTGEFTAYDKNW